MCGLAGLLVSSENWISEEYIKDKLIDMARKIKNRGPDDRKLWINSRNCLGLVFQRLSILDLSQAGSQPMLSENKDWIIVFNGEIYNYLILKKEAENWKKIEWKSRTDTEIALEYISHFGFLEAIKKFNGMFALAAFQLSTRTLWLGRDRFGEKPLYYTITKDKSLIFASEARCFSSWPSYESKLDLHVAREYLRFGYVPDPLCIFKNTKKLPPASVMKMTIGDGPKLIKYWNGINDLSTKNHSTYKGSYRDAVDELSTRLKNSVKLRMASDVPVGVFLSGGLDSTSIVRSMFAEGLDIRSFSVGFEGFDLNELPYANKIANYLKTNHNEIKISEKECLSVIEDIPDFYDEPFSDPSQIPTALLCKYARKKVTVALTGDGGDEFFGGYPRYKKIAARWRKMQNIPRIIRSLISNLSSISFEGNLTPYFVKKILRRLSHLDPNGLYLDEMSRWRPDENLFYKENNLTHSLYEKINTKKFNLCLEREFMLRDLVSYLPGNLLVKMDRASMAYGLEVRSPFLDHTLLNFCWSLPDEFTVLNGDKAILKSVISKTLPMEFIDRPKRGFEPPLFHWIRGPLLEWSKDLIYSSKDDTELLYDIGIVRERFDRLLDGEKKWTYKLWTVIMFEAWRKKNKIGSFSW